MCWVMPPASPDTTLVERMASSSEVLPWSTWPMMVTTGGRETSGIGFVGLVEQPFFDVGLGHPLDGVAHFLGDDLRGVGVDRVGDLEHLPLLHQQRDHRPRRLGHAVGKFLDGDEFRDRHLADQLVLGIGVAMTGQPLGAAAERRDRTLAHLVGGERGHQREPAAALLGGRPAGFAAGAGRAAPAPAPAPRRGRGASSSSASSAGRGPGCLRAGVAAGVAVVVSPPKCFLTTSSALRLVSSIVLAPLFFVGLARFRGFALDALDLVALLLDARFFFGDLALFGLAQPRVSERAGTRRALFLGQRPQHDARRLRGRGGRGLSRRGAAGAAAAACPRERAAGRAELRARRPCRARGSSPSRPPPPWCGRG